MGLLVAPTLSQRLRRAFVVLLAPPQRRHRVGIDGKMWRRQESTTFTGIVDNAALAHIRNSAPEALVPIAEGYVRVIN